MAPTSPGEVQAIPLPPLTVLVVDDDRNVRTVAVRILDDAGCRVIEAGTAAEARRANAMEPSIIDVALLDVVLADGRGEDVAVDLRRSRPEISIVLVSGYPEGALSEFGGVPTDLLPKPYTPSALRHAIARAVRGRSVVG
jgi:two-component system cell cycle sensor histidine kinase/response regulator CckA